MVDLFYRKSAECFATKRRLENAEYFAVLKVQNEMREYNMCYTKKLNVSSARHLLLAIGKTEEKRKVS